MCLDEDDEKLLQQHNLLVQAYLLATTVPTVVLKHEVIQNLSSV